MQLFVPVMLLAAVEIPLLIPISYPNMYSSLLQRVRHFIVARLPPSHLPAIGESASLGSPLGFSYSCVNGRGSSTMSKIIAVVATL